MTDRFSSKICCTCKERKDISDFYKNRSKKDGLQDACKKCHSECALRTRNKELTLERENRRKRDVRIKNPDKVRERERIASRNRVKNEKTKARSDLNNAVKSGLIIRPNVCSECGQSRKITAHHDNYSKPLEVIWLCYPCHGKKHRKAVD